MVMMSNARALLVVVRLATLELKLGTLLRSLERRYNVDTQKFIAQNDAGNVGCGSNIHVSLGG